MATDRLTLKDVAKHAGVSLRTVTKVIGGDNSVREKNREAVLQAMKELHYIPNKAASVMGRKQVIKLAVAYSKCTDEVYFPEIEKGFHRCYMELRDYGLVMDFHTHNYLSWEDQKHYLESLIERTDIDGVVFQPSSSTKLTSTINALVQSGKPVALFGSDVPFSDRLVYVSCDAYRAGRACGQLLEQQVEKNGRVLLFNNSTELEQVRNRTQGCLDRLHEKRPDLSVCVFWNTDSQQYYDLTKKQLESEPVAGIFCDDSHTVQVAQALKDLGRTDIPMIGFDLSECSVQLLQEGYIRFILDPRPEEFSYLAAKSMFLYLSEGIEPDKKLYTPFYLLTSECLG